MQQINFNLIFLSKINVKVEFIWHIQNLEKYLSILLKHKYILFWNTFINMHKYNNLFLFINKYIKNG